MITFRHITKYFTCRKVRWTIDTVVVYWFPYIYCRRDHGFEQNVVLVESASCVDIWCQSSAVLSIYLKSAKMNHG